MAKKAVVKKAASKALKGVRKGTRKASTSTPKPGKKSNRAKLHLNECTSKNGCHELVHEDNTPATETEVAEYEGNNFEEGEDGESADSGC